MVIGQSILHASSAAYFGTRGERGKGARDKGMI